MKRDQPRLNVPDLQLGAARRHFLSQAGVLTALSGVGAPLALNLLAAGDYKALVCLFLFGGNDAFNMVLPTDAASWTAYTATRNQAPDPIALAAPGTAPVGSAAAGSPARLGGVLPLAALNAAGQNTGRNVALHPLMSTLQTMFNSERRLAIVPNVGPLVMPTSKAQYAQATHPRPARLFSHNDQVSTWRAWAPEGATRG